MTTRAFDGIRVLELGNFLSAPLAGRVLADLGAEVLKIERPGQGDDSRTFPPFYDGESALYLQCNRNKQSIEVDMTSPVGRSLVLDLLDRCDVFLTNFLPGALERLGLDYETLQDRNPRLVYCLVSGFGAFGAQSERAAYDRSVQALSGLMRTTGSQEEPLAIGPLVVDQASAAWTAMAVASSLFERERTGRGQATSVSLVGTALDIMGGDILGFGATQVRRPRSASNDLYKASDGRWLQLAIGGNRVFRSVCSVLGIEDLADEPRFVSPQARGQNALEWRAIVSNAVLQRPAAAWEAAFVEAGVPAAAVRYIDEVLAEESLVSGHVEEFERSGTVVPQVRTPIDFSEYEPQFRTPPPTLGRDTSAVLRSVLGISESDLDGLRRAGVIGEAKE